MTTAPQSRNNFFKQVDSTKQFPTMESQEGAQYKQNILNAHCYERLKTLMLGATLKLDSTLVAFKGFISDQELDQHLDQDFYYEFDKLLFVYSK